MRRVAFTVLLIAAAGLSACKPEAPRPAVRGQSALDIMEKVAVDLGRWVAHCRDVLGYKRVVLAGWSRRWRAWDRD